MSSWWHRLLACVLLVAQAFSLCPAAVRGGTSAFQACAAGPVPPERKLDWVMYGQPGRRRCLAPREVEIRLQNGHRLESLCHLGGHRLESLCHLRVAPPHACKEPTVADDATGAAVRGAWSEHAPSAAGLDQSGTNQRRLQIANCKLKERREQTPLPFTGEGGPKGRVRVPRK